MKSERIFIKKQTIDLPEEAYPTRVSLGIIGTATCMMFHKTYHYIFRRRTYDNDMACTRCKVQWVE